MREKDGDGKRLSGFFGRKGTVHVELRLCDHSSSQSRSVRPPFPRCRALKRKIMIEKKGKCAES